MLAQRWLHKTKGILHLPHVPFQSSIVNRQSFGILDFLHPTGHLLAGTAQILSMLRVHREIMHLPGVACEIEELRFTRSFAVGPDEVLNQLVSLVADCSLYVPVGKKQRLSQRCLLTRNNRDATSPLDGFRYRDARNVAQCRENIEQVNECIDALALGNIRPCDDERNIEALVVGQKEQYVGTIPLGGLRACGNCERELETTDSGDESPCSRGHVATHLIAGPVPWFRVSLNAWPSL